MVFRAQLVLLTLLVTMAAAQDRELTPAEQKAADLRLPELDRSALEPEKREPSEVGLAERNPFARDLPPPERLSDLPQFETEEARIRRVLGAMRVSAISGSPGNHQVLLGPMLLKEGSAIPKLFSNQAEALKVGSITDREIKIVFEERSDDLEPRTLVIGFDLRPKLTSVLPGELYEAIVPLKAKGGKDYEPLPSAGAQAVIVGLKGADLQSMLDRSRELMGDPSFGTEDASKKTDAD
jgi:hypothetical protein